MTKRNNRKNLKGKTKRRNYKIGGTRYGINSNFNSNSNNNNNNNNSNAMSINLPSPPRLPSSPQLIRRNAMPRDQIWLNSVNASSQSINRVTPQRLNFSSPRPQRQPATTRRANGQPERRAFVRPEILSREEIIKKAWRSVSNNNYQFDNSNMIPSQRMSILTLAQIYNDLISRGLRNEAERMYKQHLQAARRDIGRNGGKRKRKNKTKRRNNKKSKKSKRRTKKGGYWGRRVV